MARHDDINPAGAILGMALLGAGIGLAAAAAADPVAVEAARQRRLEREAEARLAARRRELEALNAEEKILREQFAELQLRKLRLR